MKKETVIVTAGRHPESQNGIVNPPIHHASTILFPSLADYEAGERGQYHGSTYGRFGTPSSQSIEEAVAALEGAEHSIVTASGLSAITSSLLTFLGSGDHLLMTDSVYGPARRFCDQELARFGVEVTYYDPTVGKDIASLFKPNTKVVYCESPGSLTFDMQDIPAIAEVAHKRGAIVIADNTWATPLFFRSFDHGVDVSIHSVTKYMGGHSDLVMGVISSTRDLYPRILKTYRNLGPCPGPDDCYLAQRGLRTLSVRLKQHERAGLAVAEWLEKQPDVVKVLHPMLPSHPGYSIWKRDMTGATSLFSILVKPHSHDALAAMLDHLDLFGMGFSWGGYESLIIPFNPKPIRTASTWDHNGICLRLHIGLENIDDLIADLEAGFKRLNQ